MAPHRSYALASVQALLTAVKDILLAESSATGNRWLSLSRLNSRFIEQYGLSAVDMAERQSPNSSFQDLLVTSGQFSIYKTPDPDQFYVALLPKIRKTKPILKRKNRPKS